MPDERAFVGVDQVDAPAVDIGEPGRRGTAEEQQVAAAELVPEHPDAARGHAIRMPGQRAAAPVAAGVAVDAVGAVVALEGEGAGAARVDDRDVAAGAVQPATRLDLDLAVEPVGAGRDVDRGVLVERRLERGLSSATPSPTAPKSLTETISPSLPAMVRSDCPAALRLERQVGEAGAPGQVGAGLRDEELVLRGQRVRRRKLVDLLIGHGEAPPGVARPAR